VLQEHLIKNTYLDVKDLEGIWRLGKIMERDDKYLTIRFDAWDAKYEEVSIFIYTANVYRVDSTSSLKEA
jgi:hypothetical protein